MSAAVDTINKLQQMILAGQEPSEEEMLAAITALRQERGLASQASVEKKTAKVKAQSIDLAALFAPKPKTEEPKP